MGSHPARQDRVQLCPRRAGISLHDGFRPRHRRQADVQDHRLFRAAEGRPLGGSQRTARMAYRPGSRGPQPDH
jgi:hypothetical protein